MGLEEHTLADLPDRCQSCGAELTEAEKETALQEGSDPVLCAICAVEAEASIGDEFDEAE